MPYEPNQIIPTPRPLRGQTSLLTMIDDAPFFDTGEVIQIQQFTERMDVIRSETEIQNLSASPQGSDPSLTFREEAIQPVLTLNQNTFSDNADIVFYIHEKEYLKVSNKGFFISGQMVVDDTEVYKSFVEWLSQARMSSGLPLVHPKEIKPKGKPTFNRYSALTKKFKRS